MQEGGPERAGITFCQCVCVCVSKRGGEVGIEALCVGSSLKYKGSLSGADVKAPKAKLLQV